MSANCRIDIVEAIYNEDGKMTRELKAYRVPCGMSSLAYLGSHPRHTIPASHAPRLTGSKVAIFSTWSPTQQDYVIYKVL